MKKIYVLLMHTKTKPARFVKFITKYKYSHVALSLDKNCKTLYSFGRKKVDSIFKGGFTIEDKDGKFFKKFKETQCRIYELSIEDEKYEKLKKAIDDMTLNIDNYKYDFWGIVLRFFNIPVTFKNKYVCSYFVAHILEKIKICKFNKKVYFIRPKDFEHMDGFEKIYSGKYCDYDYKKIKIIS